jgi:hypothetical protein
MLQGKSSKVQHLSEAMLVAIASFAFAGVAVLAIVSGGKGGIGESGDQGGGGTRSGGGGGGGGGGGRPHQRRGCFSGPTRIVKPPFGEHCIKEMSACTTISLKKSDGGDDCNEVSWQRGSGGRRHDG